MDDELKYDPINYDNNIYDTPNFFIQEEISRHEKRDSIYGDYFISNIPQTLGTTYGTVIRQALLNWVPTTCIAYFYIPKTLLHGYRSMSGIRENIADIAQNLSKIIIQNDDLSLVSSEGFLNVSVGVDEESKEVLGRDIELPAGMQIINLDEYLFTINPDTEVNFRLLIEVKTHADLSYQKQEDPGEIVKEPDPAYNFDITPEEKAKIEGIKLAEILAEIEKQPARIATGATFQAVFNANFTVQVFVLHPNFTENFEKIRISFFTNGSCTPRIAINEACKNLSNKFSRLTGKLEILDKRDQEYLAKQEALKSYKPLSEVKVEDLPVQGSKKLSTPSKPKKKTIKGDSLPESNRKIHLEALKLSARSYNCLKRANIHTVGQLLGYSRGDLLKLKNFGRKSADEVAKVLQGLGFSLK
uniref:Plastid-encoded RNA polymerase subunit alpha n=1 Tax=Nephroselmis astigmatica TaxID=259378 RepID=A0A088CK95_9CHLO|nr:alpha subunit of RNA polymerase [Nephroselmis astigmatica]AID67722.1 alpha subunit of RNA polymerase [Nephroselmis astigmatica]